MRKLFNDRGVVHTLPLLLIIAAVGIISFLLISSTAPAGGLFGKLNPKPRSNAATPMPSGMMGPDLMNNDCNLPGQAFCDTFDNPFPVISRTGQIDPSKWIEDHVNTTVNLDQGSINTWAAANAMHCKDPISGVLPPNDIFMCGVEVPESEHFMDTLNDDDNYIFNSERILQPFDFTNRTGKIVFDVDAKTSGSHGWWIEMWITPDPVPGPHADEGHIVNVQNAIGLFWQGDCDGNGGVITGGQTGSGAVSMDRIQIVRNGVDSSAGSGDLGMSMHQLVCLPTIPDMRNHFEIKINQQHLEVWGSNPDGTNLREISYADNLNIPFSVGYIHFQDSHYDALKAFNCGCVDENITYHWDNIGFDGPVLPTPRIYPVPDSGVMLDRTHENLGYFMSSDQTPVGVTLKNVDLTSASAATLTFNLFVDAGASFRLNGGAWHSVPNAFNWSTHVIPVSLSELKTGNNLLEFQALGGRNGMFANVSLLVDANPKSPDVKISYPTSTLFAPANVPLTITATPKSPATSITKVEILQNGTTLTTLTQAPYIYNWNNVPMGGYTITAKATDNLGNIGLSQANIPILSALPLFSNVNETNITTNGATISWTTDKTSDSQVEYGTTTAYGNSTPVDSTTVTNHSMTLSGLSSATMYHFRVKSRNSVGVNTSGDFTFTTQAPAPNPLPFTAQYWNSAGGSSPAMPTTSPNLTRTDNGINFDWGNGSPDPLINADNFIARWTGTLNVPTAGTYTFSTTTDDGVRLYIDNTLVIDHWIDEAPTTYSVTQNMTAGNHTLKMEYYENGLGAVAKLGWSANVATATPAPSVTATPTAIPQPSSTACQGADIDRNGTVNIFDYNTMVGNFGKSGVGAAGGDIDGNGIVNIFDYNTLIGNFGKSGC
jgi:hypothetical protein